MLDEKFTGNGKVVLLAGGGKIYTDVAAVLCAASVNLKT